VSYFMRVLLRLVGEVSERSTWPDWDWERARIIMGVLEIRLTMVTVETVRRKIVVRERQTISFEDFSLTEQHCLSSIIF
jgi:hypothetical protein